MRALAMLLLVEGLVAFSLSPASIQSTAPPMAARRLGKQATALEKTSVTPPTTVLNSLEEFDGVVVPTAAATRVKAAAPVLRPELDAWREYEFLRGDDFDLDSLQSFFAGKPAIIAGRLFNIFTTLQRTKAAWEAGADDGLAAGEKSDKFDPTKDTRDTGPAEGRGRDLCDASNWLPAALNPPFASLYVPACLPASLSLSLCCCCC